MKPRYKLIQSLAGNEGRQLLRSIEGCVGALVSDKHGLLSLPGKGYCFYLPRGGNFRVLVMERVFR